MVAENPKKTDKSRKDDGKNNMDYSSETDEKKLKANSFNYQRNTGNVFPPPTELIKKQFEKKNEPDEIDIQLSKLKKKSNIKISEEILPTEVSKREKFIEQLGIEAEKEAIRLGLKQPSPPPVIETPLEYNNVVTRVEMSDAELSRDAARYIRANKNVRRGIIATGHSRIKNISEIKDIDSVTVLYIGPDKVPHHQNFGTVDEIIEFLEKPTTPPMYKNCTLCIVETFSDLENNLFLSEEINGVRHYLCPIAECRRDFKTISLVKRHYLKHADIKPYKCTNPECDKYFSRKDNQQLHSRKCRIGKPD